MEHQILAHLIGDYVLQSKWMATNKATQSFPAFVHVLFYTLPFCFLTTNVYALSLILGTHFLIDRFSIAKHVCKLRNYICPMRLWSDLKEDNTPAWISFWLMVIIDNTMHLVINAIILSVFA